MKKVIYKKIYPPKKLNIVEVYTRKKKYIYIYIRDSTFPGIPGIPGLKISPGGVPIEWKKAPGEAFLTYNYSKPGRKNAKNGASKRLK